MLHRPCSSPGTSACFTNTAPTSALSRRRARPEAIVSHRAAGRARRARLTGHRPGRAAPAPISHSRRSAMPYRTRPRVATTTAANSKRRHGPVPSTLADWRRLSGPLARTASGAGKQLRPRGLRPTIPSSAASSTTAWRSRFDPRRHPSPSSPARSIARPGPPPPPSAPSLAPEWLGVPFEAAQQRPGRRRAGSRSGRGTVARATVRSVGGGATARRRPAVSCTPAGQGPRRARWSSRRPPTFQFERRPASPSSAPTSRMAIGGRRAGVFCSGGAGAHSSVPGSTASASRSGEAADAARPTYPNGCHVCEVGGRSRHRRRWPSTATPSIDDVGMVINPMIRRGPDPSAGIAQGVGQALLESVEVRRGHPASSCHRQLPRLRHAARRRSAVVSTPSLSMTSRAKTNRARHQGHRGGRHDRCPGHQSVPCSTRCTISASSIWTCRSRPRASGRR